MVARNYLINENPDAVLNIVDGTNLERNLYLTTQLAELGLPMVVAVNMMDVVAKQGDKIDTKKLAAELGCPVVEISALKGTGIDKAVAEVVQAVKKKVKMVSPHSFSGAWGVEEGEDQHGHGLKSCENLGHISVKQNSQGGDHALLGHES